MMRESRAERLMLFLKLRYRESLDLSNEKVMKVIIGMLKDY